MQSAALPPAPLDTQGCALRGVRVPCQAPAHVHTCVCWVCESSERPRTLEMLGSKRCLGCCDSCVPGRQFLYTKAQGGLWHSVPALSTPHRSAEAVSNKPQTQARAPFSVLQLGSQAALSVGSPRPCPEPIWAAACPPPALICSLAGWGPEAL